MIWKVTAKIAKHLLNILSISSQCLTTRCMTDILLVGQVMSQWLSHSENLKRYFICVWLGFHHMYRIKINYISEIVLLFNLLTETAYCPVLTLNINFQGLLLCLIKETFLVTTPLSLMYSSLTVRTRWYLATYVCSLCWRFLLLSS